MLPLIIPFPRKEPQSKHGKKHTKKATALHKTGGWRKRFTYFGFGAVIGGLGFIVSVGGGFWITFHNRALPGVVVADMPVSGKSQAQIEAILTTRVDNYRSTWPLTLAYENYSWTLPFPEKQISFDIQSTAREALKIGRQGTIMERGWSWWKRWQQASVLPLQVTVDDSLLTQLTATIAGQLNVEMIPPAVSIGDTLGGSDSPTITVSPGEPGRSLRADEFSRQFKQSVARLTKPTLPEYVESHEVSLTVDEVGAVQIRAHKLIDQELVIRTASEAGDGTWTLPGNELVGLMQLPQGFDRQKILDYLTGVSLSVNRQPVNARFVFKEDSQKVEEFAPPQLGLALEASKSAELMINTLTQYEQTGEMKEVKLAVQVTKPEVTLAEVNDLGIKELLGRGESDYKGSITTRVHNVALAASRINGTIIKPGETLSFNQAVGEVSGATGYQQAYIIQNGRTVLGDGGGVCQDSTTVFRAALDAGLPIVYRRAHAYRVGYYEQNAKPGLDATVYSPSTDLKILNDTPAYILLEAVADTPKRHLTVSIYGTSDGRTATITNQAVWGITPPPPDVYVDDPTMAAGVVKQVDWKAWGAKAKFDYTVMRAGEVIYQKTFTSNYQPWANVFLRGTMGQ